MYIAAQDRDFIYPRTIQTVRDLSYLGLVQSVHLAWICCTEEDTGKVINTTGNVQNERMIYTVRTHRSGLQGSLQPSRVRDDDEPAGLPVSRQIATAKRDERMEKRSSPLVDTALAT